jgi:hypothetical protein
MYVIAGIIIIGALLLFFETIGPFVFIGGILILAVGFAADVDEFKGVGIIMIMASLLMFLYIITVGSTQIGQFSKWFVQTGLNATNPP